MCIHNEGTVENVENILEALVSLFWLYGLKIERKAIKLSKLKQTYTLTLKRFFSYLEFVNSHICINEIRCSARNKRFIILHTFLSG